MATVTHTIYSHYDVKDRERFERETGQLEEKLEADQSWKTEPPNYRNQAPAPQFVPATIAYDPWSFSQPSSSQQRLEMADQSIDNNTVQWYRSLRKMLAADDGTNARRPSSAPAAPPQQASATSKSSRHTCDPRPKRDKNNWFIMNAINSEPPSTSTTPKPPPPTLADILERDPPPKPTEPKYTPPVFLEIGPNNRGFAMLQKSGWSEGEALGPDIMRRGRKTDQEEVLHGLFGDRVYQRQDNNKGKEKIKARSLLDANQQRPGDIIDLTQSDSEESDSHIDGDESLVVSGSTFPLTGQPDVEEDLAYGRKALLTPLATALKSDRLGIGLKAKTVGPYKASRKRITHNAAALAAHIRASGELQKKKKEHGRGRRGFEREYRREAMKRQMMLADFNS
ncbi:hypothetical protein JOM56_010731 [Amanita muscaria]